MANDISTIQSLKAVDAWIDVINANINGGVRTAFKASRLRFAGSNTQLDRAPASTTLPLQFPEPSLITANTVIDFTQGAVTSSTETTHLAIQGDGFFVLASPDIIAADGSTVAPNSPAATTRKFFITRDGEFHTDKNGLLVHASGYYLVTWNYYLATNQSIAWDGMGNSGATGCVRGVYNDLDLPIPATTATRAVRLSNFATNVTGTQSGTMSYADGVTFPVVPNYPWVSLMQVPNKQLLSYTALGSTVFDIGYQAGRHDGKRHGESRFPLGDATGVDRHSHQIAGSFQQFHDPVSARTLLGPEAV